MATFGSGINPSLGATDYSAILRGAQSQAQGILAGGQAIGQGIASLGQGIASYMKEQDENKAMMGNIAGADPQILQGLAKNDPKMQKIAEGLAKGKGPNRGDLMYATSKLSMAEKQQAQEFAKWQQQQARASAEEAAQTKRSIGFGMAALSNGTMANPLEAIQAAGGQITPGVANFFADLEQTKAQTGKLKSETYENLNPVKKPENLSFQEQTFASAVSALEQNQGRRATPQQKADLQMSILRGASQGGDPELIARLNILSKELPEVGARASAALRLKPTISSLMSKMEDGLATGKLEAIKADVLGFAKSLGVPVDAEALGKTESARSQFANLMWEFISQSKGSTSERENTLFSLMGPEFDKSPAANNDLLKLVKSRMDLDVNLGKIYRDGLSRGKPLSAINEDLQVERDAFSQKYDSEVESMLDSYYKKKVSIDAIREEIKRRASAKGARK